MGVARDEVVFELVLPALQATEALGHALGRALAPGDHLALKGAMGAGKTTLTRSIAEGFGVLDLAEVASPTYAYAHMYRGVRGTLHHLDFYRLADSETAMSLGLDEMLADAGAVCVVEWADLVDELLHENAVWLELGRKPGEAQRTARLAVPRARAAQWLAAVKEAVPPCLLLDTASC